MGFKVISLQNLLHAEAFTLSDFRYSIWFQLSSLQLVFFYSFLRTAKQCIMVSHGNIYSEILATLDYSLGKLWRVKFYANCKLGLKCFWKVGVLSLFHAVCSFFAVLFSFESLFLFCSFPLSFLRIPAQNPHCSLIQSQSAGFCTENCHSKSWA